MKRGSRALDNGTKTGRTGEEVINEWRKDVNQEDAYIIVVRDKYYNSFNYQQTRFGYKGGVFNFQIILNDEWDKLRILRTIDGYIPFNRYLLVPTPLNGQTNTSWDFYTRIHERPDLDTVKALYKAFCEMG